MYIKDDFNGAAPHLNFSNAGLPWVQNAYSLDFGGVAPLIVPRRTTGEIRSA